VAARGSQRDCFCFVRRAYSDDRHSQPFEPHCALPSKRFDLFVCNFYYLEPNVESLLLDFAFAVCALPQLQAVAFGDVDAIVRYCTPLEDDPKRKTPSDEDIRAAMTRGVLKHANAVWVSPHLLDFLSLRRPTYGCYTLLRTSKPPCYIPLCALLRPTAPLHFRTFSVLAIVRLNRCR